MLIENVPARVNEETGEQFFAAATVERLQKIILDGREPEYCVQIPRSFLHSKANVKVCYFGARG